MSKAETVMDFIKELQRVQEWMFSGHMGSGWEFPEIKFIMRFEQPVKECAEHVVEEIESIGAEVEINDKDIEIVFRPKDGSWPIEDGQPQEITVKIIDPEADECPCAKERNDECCFGGGTGFGSWKCEHFKGATKDGGDTFVSQQELIDNLHFPSPTALPTAKRAGDKWKIVCGG